MKVIATSLPAAVESALETWRLEAEKRIAEGMKPHGGRFVDKGGADYATGETLLAEIDWAKHDGYPPDSLDYDFTRLPTDHNWALDGVIQREIGYKRPALKVVYGPDHYFAWHDNRNASGLNLIFTWSDAEARGFFRHVDAATGEIVTIPDVPGWSCKMGEYGAKEGSRLKHCAAANGSRRCTIGYIVGHRGIWDDIIEELAGG